jgi:uncharacterized protein YndB with AHSA1/START domain
MATKKQPAHALRVGDEAVKAKTGRTWAQWFAALDRAGAVKLPRAEIVRIVRGRSGCPAWWGQMVTVAYEQARGLRVKHQTAAGFSVSASRTVAVPLARLYAAWATPAARRRWLPGAKLAVSRTTPGRSVRGAWDGGPGRIEALFTARGRDRSQVAVQHSKLPDAKAAARMKTFWGARLDRLEAVLEPAG